LWTSKHCSGSFQVDRLGGGAAARKNASKNPLKFGLMGVDAGSADVDALPGPPDLAAMLGE